MPIFMKAGAIQGDVVAQRFQGWVEVETCAFDFAFDADDVRKSLDAGEPEPRLGSFTMTKTTTDRSGPALLEWMVSGRVLDKVEVDVCGDTVGQGQWRTHLRYTLEQVTLREYEMDMTDAEQGAAKVTLKLDCRQIGIEHIVSDKGNTRRTAARSVVLARVR
jgi:type VI protein secretion system component Hcp